MDLHIVHHERFQGTSPDIPGARASGNDLDEAIDRLHHLAELSTRPSPFATVQKRLAERHARTTTSW